MHRWAFIGTGDISRRLASDLLTVEPGAITAVWGRTDATRPGFADDHGIAFASDSLEHVLALDTVDIVYIATPAATHLRIRAAGAGGRQARPRRKADDHERRRHRADLRRRRAKPAGSRWRRCGCASTRSTIEIRRRIADGLIGEVNSVRASFGTPFQARGRILSPAQGGSILLDRGIYPITLAQWFLGEPTAIAATGDFQDGVDVRGHATPRVLAGIRAARMVGHRVPRPVGDGER